MIKTELRKQRFLAYEFFTPVEKTGVVGQLIHENISPEFEKHHCLQVSDVDNENDIYIYPGSFWDNY